MWIPNLYCTQNVFDVQDFMFYLHSINYSLKIDVIECISILNVNMHAYVYV